MQRGTCPFGQKATNAAAAGAVAVIIYDEGTTTDASRQELLAPTLGEVETDIPVIGVSHATGRALLLGQDPVTLTAETEIRTAISNNVIAETRGGRADDVVMLGAHLDSVAEGPGINDNGSGSAAILETALQLAKDNGDRRVNNAVRFAWWSAEESGLIGSATSRARPRPSCPTSRSTSTSTWSARYFAQKRLPFEDTECSSALQGAYGSRFVGNVNTTALDTSADAIAHAVATHSSSTQSVNGEQPPLARTGGQRAQVLDTAEGGRRLTRASDAHASLPDGGPGTCRAPGPVSGRRRSPRKPLPVGRHPSHPGAADRRPARPAARRHEHDGRGRGRRAGQPQRRQDRLRP